MKNAHATEQELTNLIAKDFRDAKSAIGSVGPAVADAARELRDASTRSLLRQSQNVDKAVRTSPWYYIGGATAVATLIGFFAGRRSKPSKDD